VTCGAFSFKMGVGETQIPESVRVRVLLSLPLAVSPKLIPESVVVAGNSSSLESEFVSCCKFLVFSMFSPWNEVLLVVCEDIPES